MLEVNSFATVLGFLWPLQALRKLPKVESDNGQSHLNLNDSNIVPVVS